MGKKNYPSDDIAILHHEIGRIFRDVLSEEDMLDRSGFPAIDIIETGDSLLIEIEIPGLEKADIKLEISGNTLLMEGTKQDYEKAGRTNYICMERRFGYFKRAVTLPTIGDASGIKTFYENGILTIMIPKVTDRRGTVKQIEID